MYEMWKQKVNSESDEVRMSVPIRELCEWSQWRGKCDCILLTNGECQTIINNLCTHNIYICILLFLKCHILWQIKNFKRTLFSSVENLYLASLHILREESSQTNVILQYKLLASILGAVCSVIQQS